MTDIEREDIHVRTRDGHPMIKIGEAELVLKTHFEGAPAEEVDVDHYDSWPFYVLDFDEEYFDGLLEIAPEFVPAEDTDSQSGGNSGGGE